MGDLNLDLFNHDTNSLVLLINHPTKVISNTSTLIDDIVYNYHEQLVKAEEGVFISSISDQYAIFHIDNIQSPEKNAKSSEKRLTNRIQWRR